MKNIWGIVLAGGSGKRFGGTKQYVKLGEQRLIDHSIALTKVVCDFTCIVIPQGTTWDGDEVDLVVEGGSTHAQSTRNAVVALPKEAEILLITGPSHPLATPSLARAVLKELDTGLDACAPMLPLADAVKVVNKQNRVRSAKETRRLHTTQLPLALRKNVFCAAIQKQPEFLEELEAIEAIGGSIGAIEGDPQNIHIATRDDLTIAQAIHSLRLKKNL